MTRDDRTREELLAEIAELRARLEEPEQTVRAIRSGAVDAFVVAGERVCTLSGAEPPYRRMIERMQEGAAILTDDGIVLYANRRLAEMVHTPVEQLPLVSFREIVVAPDRADFDALLRRSSPGESRGELALTAQDGSTVPVAVALSDLSSRDGPQICVVVTDLSAQKRHENEIAGYAERLRTLASKLVLAEQRERRRFASELHDSLAQHLVVCRMAIDRALRGSGPEVRTALDQAHSALGRCVDYCRSMVADISPAVLYEGGLFPALRWLAQRMERQGLHVELDLQGRPQRLGEDQGVMIFQAVCELLRNVHRHAGVDRARLEVRERDGTLTLTITDAGRGFDPARAAKPANGYGLFAMRQHLANLGGRLEIDSGPGGSRVTITVPHTGAAAVPRHGDPAQGRKLRVLLVDDHATVREGLRRILGIYPEIEIIAEAADGEEAVALSRTLEPDVVLMDINMPKLDGIEATRQIKGEGIASHVIGLSMHDASEFSRAMLEAGAAAYLTKDVRGEQLRAAIHDCAEVDPFRARQPMVPRKPDEPT